MPRAPADVPYSDTAPSAQIDALVAANAAMVRRALRQLGVAPAMLDDAVQDVFVVLVRRIEDFDHDRSLTNWLWGIAKGVASGYRRSGRRRGRLHAALSQCADAPSVCSRPGEVEARCGGPGRPTWAVPLPADARNVERTVAGSQASEILERFLGTLDEGKCAVFVLSEIEGCTGPEIAERLALNVNTVYARLRAARRAFKDAVGDHHDTRARPLFAGLLPPLAKPLSLATAAAVATVLALPMAIPAGLDERAPRLAGYSAIPDAPAARAAVEPTTSDVDGTATPSRIRRSATVLASSDAHADDGALAAALDFPFEDAPVLHTEWPDAGQGLSRGHADEQRAEGRQPMLTTLALAAAVAAPSPAPTQTNADADDAARVGDEGVTRIYEFFDEELEGDVLKDDGSVILHRPDVRFTSMLEIRAHFLPELMTLATDV